MCGIVGIVGLPDVVPALLEGLSRLEYRGYDSAGVAVVDGRGALRRARSAGRIAKLRAVLAAEPLAGTCGIAHTRWATHGRPTDENAHPHASCRGDVALVHNGIIENYLELRERLTRSGHELRTETDTEVLAHLVEEHLAGQEEHLAGQGEHLAGAAAGDLAAAVAAAVAQVRGVHALAVVGQVQPDRLVVTTNGPPALVGLADGFAVIASDLAPILPHARRVVFLEEGDVAEVTATSVTVRDASGAVVERAPRVVEWNPVEAERGGYKHFMLKEIFEQPRTIEDSLAGHLRAGSCKVDIDGAELDDDAARAIERVLLLGCGTSHHAGLVGRYLVENLARVPCDVEIGSEFRYRRPVLSPSTLAVAITQSGETADTIAAMREAQAGGARVLAACNVLGSLATRLADGVLPTRAGIEIGVASTKAFTAQLVAMTLLALRLGQARGTLSEQRSKELVAGLRSLPRIVEETLDRAADVESVARAIADAAHCLFLGRGVLYPVALEGALKLKEISYIHAEGYPAGEMKHGPIALIDADMPVIGLCPRTSTYDKMASNLQEVKARDGRLIALVTDGDDQVAASADHVLTIPPVDEWLVPIVATIPLQLLAYHVAVRRGCDVDQPRNLAKSVTVE